MAGYDDPFAPMPKEWWQLPATVHLMVRYRYAQLGDDHQRLAFAEQFHSSLSVYGTRYLNLAELTRIDAYNPETDPARWHSYRLLTGRHPGLFTTVIGRSGPQSVWLALPLSELSGPVADTLRQVHHRLTTPTRPPPVHERHRTS
jgi:hypothetical protein